MTAPILLQPLPQFCDANGRPYVGGQIFTYVKGTTTPKPTWKDPEQAAGNTNPIVLDAAGRCSMWGDGDYRLVLYDTFGNSIWDAPSTTIVSAAMYPVVSASTTLDAMWAMGVTGAISAEADGRVAGDTAEGNARAAADAELQANIEAEGTARESEIEAEAAARYNQDNALQAQISALSGSPVELAQGGVANLTFGIGTNFATHDITFTPFATACHAVVVTPADVLFTTVGGFSNLIFNITNLTNGGARINATGLAGSTSSAASTFNTAVYWVATGS